MTNSSKKDICRFPIDCFQVARQQTRPYVTTEQEKSSMTETLNKLSKLTGIDIPKEEYAESSGEDISK